MAATVDFNVSQIGPIAPLLLLVEDHFETIRDTDKSTVSATGIDKMKNALNKLSWSRVYTY